MTISAIGAQTAGFAAQSAHYASSGNEAREVGPDRDGDADDSRNAVARAPSVVNANGQTIGGTIDVTA